MDRQRPPKDDYNKPLPKQKPLPFLPEREWLGGRINKVEYEFVYFNNQIQYLTDQDKQPILDENGEPIPRRQFEIEIMLNNHTLSNGEARRIWLKLGASMGGKAHLPQFLRNMGLIDKEPTPQGIIDFLSNQDIRFQVVTKTSESSLNEYQLVIWDSVKPE